MHVSALNAYVSESVVPKGLMIVHHPAVKLSPTHQAKWDDALKNASLNLTRIILNHYEHSAKSLSNTVRQLLSQSRLSSEQVILLDEYRLKKRDEIVKIKMSKLARDNVPIPASLTTVASRATSRTSCRTSEHDNIVNLSNHCLSDDEKSVLSRGLNFCPASGGYNEFQFLQDLDNFARNMRLREFFYNMPTSSNSTAPLFSNKRWTPPIQREKCLDLYIEAVQRDLLEAYQKQQPFKSNISIKEKEAIKSLANNTDIVIKQADKGGAIVLMNRVDYISEAYRQLRNDTFYRRLEMDPTNDFKCVIKKELEQLVADKKLTVKDLSFLLPLSPSAGRFYLLPKIHKTGNPGRPIVSAIGSVTEKISSFVDTLISHIPQTYPSYIKDSGHFLSDIADLIIPEGSLLVTLDVCSLYTNIPHKDGIEAVRQEYERSASDHSIDGATLATLLKLILQYNNFEFNDDHFVQVNGTSMGTKIGPNYANIFMGVLEKEFLSSQTLTPLFYKRYIDDIFLIWEHGEHALLSFITAFNNVHSSISFSHSFSDKRADFLDITVFLRNGRLSTTLFKKPTDRHQYLHFHSSHLKHWKTSIPYSQALRFKRVCTHESDYHQNCTSLRESLVKQNYPVRLVEDAFKKADLVERKTLLKAPKKTATSRLTNLVLTHSASAPRVNCILQKHHNILLQSQRLRTIFPIPPKVIYRRSKNLHDLVTSSKVTKPQYSGCHPCNKSRCKICAHMTTSLSAQSTASGFSLKIKGNFCCYTSNVIYLLECSVCGMQYIGQTETSFRLRFNNHKAHAISLPNLPLSKHVALPGHSFSKIKATILESGFSSHRDREVRESYLIHKFSTIAFGLNENPGTLTFLRQ